MAATCYSFRLSCEALPMFHKTTVCFPT